MRGSRKEEANMLTNSWVLLWTWREVLLKVRSPFYPSGGLADSKIIGGNTRQMSQLHSWLHSRLQSQANSYWSLCYRASSHGWGSSTFHSYCDRRGPTVTIIRAHGYIFGGYTDQSWRCKFVNCLRIWYLIKNNWHSVLANIQDYCIML